MGAGAPVCGHWTQQLLEVHIGRKWVRVARKLLLEVVARPDFWAFRMREMRLNDARLALSEGHLALQ